MAQDHIVSLTFAALGNLLAMLIVARVIVLFAMRGVYRHFYYAHISPPKKTNWNDFWNGWEAMNADLWWLRWTFYAFTLACVLASEAACGYALWYAHVIQ